MIIEKVTEGVIVQRFDTDKQEFTGQKFFAGDQCMWEHESGRPVDDDEFDCSKWYLPYTMVQPDEKVVKE